jgi:hypothetical protein
LQAHAVSADYGKPPRVTWRLEKTLDTFLAQLVRAKYGRTPHVWPLFSREAKSGLRRALDSGCCLPRAEAFRPELEHRTLQPVTYPSGPRAERWRYRPAWAVARKVPMMAISRLDKRRRGRPCGSRGTAKSAGLAPQQTGQRRYLRSAGLRRLHFYVAIKENDLLTHGRQHAAAARDPSRFRHGGRMLERAVQFIDQQPCASI